MHFNIRESIFLKIWIHSNSFQSILVCWERICVFKTENLFLKQWICIILKQIILIVASFTCSHVYLPVMDVTNFLTWIVSLIINIAIHHRAERYLLAKFVHFMQKGVKWILSISEMWRLKTQQLPCLYLTSLIPWNSF